MSAFSKLLVGVVAVVSVGTLLRSNEPPSTPTNVHSTGLALTAERERAQHERDKMRCTDGAAELAKASAAAIKRKDSAEAVRMLAPCMSIPETPSEIRTAHASAQKTLQTEKRLADAAEKKRKKSQGVSIGMSQTDVLESSWGKPKRINRTINKYKTREQWVYGNGYYLYFEDGVLSSIQN